jgi:hypothetical protein
MSKNSPYGPSFLDPDVTPIHEPMEHAFDPGDKFLNIREKAIVEVLRCMNDTVHVRCIKCARPNCDKEFDYDIEYFDRVFNPVIDVELP